MNNAIYEIVQAIYYNSERATEQVELLCNRALRHNDTPEDDKMIFRYVIGILDTYREVKEKKRNERRNKCAEGEEDECEEKMK